MDKNLKVTCFGAGFVGLPTSSVLAFHNPQSKFIVYDILSSKIDQCKKGIMPIFQPNLDDMMKKVNGKNLEFTDDIKIALDHPDVIFLALPTPTKTSGENAGKAYDLAATQTAIRDILRYYNRNAENLNKVILVQKSTVPIGTSKMIQTLISQISIEGNKSKFVVASNPEFLAEGSAINDLMKPDRVILGERQGDNIDNLMKLYSYVDSKIIRTNQASSELSKLVANCFLAQRVSSINSIAILCQEYDADIKEVRKCISADTRIGDKFLNSSVGFGGSCFKKDMLALIYLAQLKGLHEVADYWMSVIQMNNHRKKKFFQRIFKTLNTNLKRKKLCILGTAFKKDTNDARQSPAVDICHDLLIEGAILNIYDPKTSRENFVEEMKLHGSWKEEFDPKMIQFEEVEQACVDAHAIIILTQWDMFKQLNYKKFYEKMQRPSFLFDGRNILEENKMSEIGFKYCCLGRKSEWY